MSYSTVMLIAIVFFAFVIRLAGINYGLPLWLIGDEPPFITAALKIIELKIILPFLHQTELKQTLYFPPYLAQFYTLFFVPLLGLKYLFFGGTIATFKNYIVSDLSDFFILARIINVLLGTATVWLVYKIAKNIFNNERIALLSSAMLALSVLHIYISAVARDWTPATFMFALGSYFITNQRYSFKKRYIVAAIISGLAFGISLIAGFLMLFMLFWYLFYEKHSLLDIFKEKILYIALFIFFILAGISIAMYPYGFHLSGDNSLVKAKSFYDYILSLLYFFKPILVSEPALFVSALAGLIFSFQKHRRFFWTVSVFLFSYATVFYIVFHYEQRFTVYSFPILALCAGYGINAIIEIVPKRAIIFMVLLIFALPLATSLRLDWLMIKNDSRIHARQWIENNLPSQSKILVHADMMRLSSIPQAILEQQYIDPASLRQVDYAEMRMEQNKRADKPMYALNLYSIHNKDFYRDIWNYASKNKYKYIVLDPYYDRAYEEKAVELDAIANSGKLIASFGNQQTTYDMRDGNFGAPLGLFQLESLGPIVKIYQLHHE